MTEEFKAARNHDNPIFVLPTALLEEDICIIDAHNDHIVLTVRLPLDLIRDNHALLLALSELAGGKPSSPAEPEDDLDA